MPLWSSGLNGLTVSEVSRCRGQGNPLLGLLSGPNCMEEGPLSLAVWYQQESCCICQLQFLVLWVAVYVCWQGFAC